MNEHVCPHGEIGDGSCPECSIKERIELKPCPFCGKEVARILTSGEQFRVYCPAYASDGGCGAGSGYTKTKTEAIAKWNNRA